MTSNGASVDSASERALFQRATELKQRGDWGTAKERFAELLGSANLAAAARFELAGLLLAEGDAKAALPHLEALLALAPEQPRVLCHFAAAQAALGRDDIASQTCDRVLASPAAAATEIAAIAYTLGSVGRIDEALASARRALSMAPDSLEVRSAAAGALAHAGRAAEAQQHFMAVAAARPRVPLNWRRLGLAALAAGDGHGAAEAFDRQAGLTPRDRGALLSLGGALGEIGRREDRIAVYERALEAGHRDAEVLAEIVREKAAACAWGGLDALVTELRAIAQTPSRTPAQPQVALYFETSASEQRAWAEIWARVQYPSIPPTFEPAREPESRRIRVGYLSSDFYDHPTARLMAGVLEHHDRSRFEIFAYSPSPDDGTPLRRRLGDAVEHFVDVASLPGRQVIQRIAADRLDVLLDLGGYVRGSCTAILARRPARLQGQFLGYPGTTGAPFIDFMVADPFVVPHGRERDFTERVLRMPVCYQPNDPKRTDPAPTPRAASGLPEEALVLCSFNQAVKIRPAVFTRWCRLLEAVPQAVLWLSDHGAAANGRLRAFAAQNRIDPERIVFAPALPQAEHIARLRVADIALDTFPCTSHTTASDAIWAGVPLVTTYGETFASRVAGSVLNAAGLGDWAFADADDAFAATLALARDAQLRGTARVRVANARASALFDAAAFAREFEALLDSAVAMSI